MAVQKRTLKTRENLVQAAKRLVALNGYKALRVDDLVKNAGVAKGTFFAHFTDKDALMDHLIGAELDQFLDQIEKLPAPKDLAELLRILLPSTLFMARDRYVFDVILRHSGATAKEEIGPIAQFFMRHGIVLAQWLDQGPFRKDISAALLAEGVGAFQIQAIALHFCALHSETELHTRLETYLEAWLLPAMPRG